MKKLLAIVLILIPMQSLAMMKGLGEFFRDLADSESESSSLSADEDRSDSLEELSSAAKGTTIPGSSPGASACSSHPDVGQRPLHSSQGLVPLDKTSLLQELVRGQRATNLLLSALCRDLVALDREQKSIKEEQQSVVPEEDAKDDSQ